MVSRDRDLTPQQARLLCVLTTGPAGMTELSRSLSLEKSSVTGLVDRVEQRGLVTRTRADHDRRACHVALTDEGSRVAVECHREICTRLETLAGELPPGDRDRLVSAIGQLLAAR